MSHSYLSTACLHAVIDRRPELHTHCQTNTIRPDGSPKVAAQCKWCAARCACDCHRNAGAGGPGAPTTFQIFTAAGGGWTRPSGSAP